MTTGVTHPWPCVARPAPPSELSCLVHCSSFLCSVVLESYSNGSFSDDTLVSHSGFSYSPKVPVIWLYCRSHMLIAFCPSARTFQDIEKGCWYSWHLCSVNTRWRCNELQRKPKSISSDGSSGEVTIRSLVLVTRIHYYGIKTIKPSWLHYEKCKSSFFLVLLNSR